MNKMQEASKQAGKRGKSSRKPFLHSDPSDSTEFSRLTALCSINASFVVQYSGT